MATLEDTCTPAPAPPPGIPPSLELVEVPAPPLLDILPPLQNTYKQY